MLHKASLHSRSFHKDLGEARLFLWIEGRSSKVKVIIFNVTAPSKGVLHQSREADPVGPAQKAHKEWGILWKMTKERYRWRIGSRVKSQGQVPALLLTPNCGMTMGKIYLSPLRPLYPQVSHEQLALCDLQVPGSWRILGFSTICDD